MLSYPLPEAESLLDSKLEVAKSSLANCEEDLDFLREQITVRQRTHAGCEGLYETAVLTWRRQWKSPRLESTTGTSVSGARTRQTARAMLKTRARKHPTAEANCSGGGGVFAFGLVSQRHRRLADTLVVAGFQIHQHLSRKTAG